MNLFSEIIAFFEGHAAQTPAVQQAAHDVRTAATSVEAAIEPLADEILNLVLERIPLVGGLLTGPADALLNSFITKLVGKFPTATALAPIQATMQPVPN